ncbi:hypothetical protein PENTCL1PPCAC_26422 [Pristionchus entomophagus]|uniref:Late endosomal/lysosomal adaptor and MAPK and MTOR activator 5 n=1 Tax=Pristionchus entomophagus TaxID=358040 RepID=A0AAV5UC37_9BILA|nr:hypothetical protein PENTCL1PPCAC_26422 [Pristionchus entomophagus]
MNQFIQIMTNPIIQIDRMTDREEMVRNVMEEVSCGAVGVVVADSTGLVIASKGTMGKESAAVGTQLISLAAELDPRETKPAVIHLQSEAERMVFSRNGNITLGVHYKR